MSIGLLIYYLIILRGVDSWNTHQPSLYSFFSDNVWMPVKYLTHKDRVHGGFKLKGDMHHFHYENILSHYTTHNVVFSLRVNLVTNITPNIYTYVKIC